MSALSEIRAKHPFPWRELVQPTGVIQVFDAAGGRVQLLDLINFVKIVTNQLGAEAPKPAAA